jgi:hypothetical protein
MHKHELEKLKDWSLRHEDFLMGCALWASTVGVFAYMLLLISSNLPLLVSLPLATAIATLPLIVVALNNTVSYLRRHLSHRTMS